MPDEKNTDNTTQNNDSEEAGNADDSNVKSIIPAEITTEMQSAYLDYAMSVIVSRALPDVRDGLKPVQRRIIYAMQDQNMTADGRYHKCAAVVGDVLRRYHPHGDVAVYDALVRMGQDFSLRYPLIWGQGNFGSIDGDPPAAMRYTECKMQKISEDLYRDIDKDTVDFEMNDLQNMEPVYLPSVLPNILLNGSSGIAVGMATNIPPHNLSEVIDGISLMIEMAEEIGAPPEKGDKGLPYELFDGKGDTINIKASTVDFSSGANVENLIEHIKGPDFPTGGIIYNQKEMMQAYATGKGRIVTRAKTEIEEDKNGRMRILVTEIPYQVNKSTLIEKIADLARNKKISGISDLRDESNREGMRIVIELKKEAIPQKVQNQLFKYSQLQSTFNANMVALIDREPKLMTLKMILEEFIKHRQQIVVRRTIYLLKKAKEREHILQGLKIALDNLDEVIKLIRNSPDVETARNGLMKNFDLSEVQAQAILDMQLRRLAALERKKIEDELKDTIGVIEGHEELLISPQKIIDTVRDELTEIKEKYGGERNTKVIKGKVGEIEDEDLIANKPCIITISESGYIKRLGDDTYKKQKRGGKGVLGQALKEEDAVQTIRTCETHDYAFFFTNKGKVYKMRVWDIPESSRTAKGTALVNFLNVSQDETVQAFLKIGPEDLEKGGGYVFFCTEKGIVKKTSLDDFANIRSSGIMAIRLGDDDNLAWARFTSGKDEILITTAMGQSIRFNEDDVRAMGRVAAGVIGVKLTKKEDNVVGMVVIPAKNGDMELIVVSENGYGKKSSLDDYKVQNRGGSGILTYKVSGKTGKLVTGRAVTKGSDSDVLIVTTHGKVIRLATKQVPELGRATMGVKLINLDKGDKASSVAIFGEDEED